VSVVDLQLAAHVRAVRDHLLARGVLADVGRKPAGGGWTGTPGQSPFQAYAIVRRTAAVETSNLLMQVRYDEARPAVHITCVGADEDQANDLHDLVMSAMLDGTLTVPGREIQRVIPEVSSTSDKDPDETPAVWFAGARYRLWTLPGAGGPPATS
jgi:hypothetical protein